MIFHALTSAEMTNTFCFLTKNLTFIILLPFAKVGQYCVKYCGRGFTNLYVIIQVIICHLRTRRALSLLKCVPLRTRRALSP